MSTPDKPPRLLRAISWLSGAALMQGLMRGCVSLMDVLDPQYVELEGRRFPLSPRGDPGYVSMLMLAIAGLLGLWSSSIAKNIVRRRQSVRDEFAQQLAARAKQYLEDLHEGRSLSPFVLYLRPFALDNRLKPAFRSFSISSLLGKRLARFDADLFTKLERLNLTLISLGQSDGEEGAGRVTMSEQEWRARFRELAGLAHRIIVVPGRQPSIVAEVNWLRAAGLLGNAVFFKPRGYPRAEWRSLQLAGESEDIEYPDYSPKQMSFLTYYDGRCHGVSHWKGVRNKSAAERGRSQMDALLLNGIVERD